MESCFVLRGVSNERFTDLKFCFCGYEQCKPRHSFGPAVRPVYIMHYVLSGKGTFQKGNNRWEILEGEGFLIEPSELTYYQADTDDPWHYIWVGFDGEKAGDILKDLGIGAEQPVFRCHRKSELKQVILSMLKNSENTIANDFILQSQLYLFFSILFQDLELGSGQNQGSENRYVQMAENYIRANFTSAMKISDIADYLSINRSYLYTLFHKEKGISPQQYLVNYRLTRAAELLGSTEYPVDTVAFSCGYKDPAVFSKAFKSYHNISPLKYRQRAQKDAKEKFIKSSTELDKI